VALTLSISLRPFATIALTLALAACASSGPRSSSGPVSTTIEPGTALQALKDGNARYLSGDVRTHDWLHERIVKTGTDGQTPSVGVHTIVVMGHTKCGAVGATVAGKDLPGKMPAFVAAIKPAIAGLPKGADGKASVADAEIANVRWQAAQLVKNSEILSKAKDDGKLTVLCAIYDVESGAVRFLD
jgi:hypothetical protein